MVEYYMMIKQVESKPTGISFGKQKLADERKTQHKGVEPQTNKRVSNYDIIRAKVTDGESPPSQGKKEKINIGL